MLVAPLVLTMALALTIPASSDPAVTVKNLQQDRDQEVERAMETGRRMTKAFSQIQRPVMFDFDPAVGFPDTTYAFRTFDDLHLLASASRRVFEETDGCLVFGHLLDAEEDFLGWSYRPLQEWLTGLTPEKRALLFTKGLTLDEASPDPASRGRLLAAMAFSPDNAVDLLENRGTTRLRLSTDCRIEGTGIDGRAKVLGTFPPRRPSMPSPSSASEKPIAVPEIAPFEMKDGPFDAGEGRMERIGVLVREAGRLFNVRYVVDDRLMADWVFVKGKWDKDHFERALLRISQSMPLSKVSQSRESRQDFFRGELEGELAWLKDAFADQYSAEIYGAMLKGQALPGSAVGDFPAIRQLLEQKNLSADRMSFRFRPGMILFVDIPGERKMSDGNALSKSYGIAYP